MQHNYIEIIRWIMVVPAAVIGWWLAIIFGLSLTHIPLIFCPPELVESELCMASWYGPVMSGLMTFAAGLSAVMTMLFAVLVAPGRRELVAKVVFVAGFIYATYLAFSLAAWAEYMGAVAFGLVTLYLLTKKFARRVATWI